MRLTVYVKPRARVTRVVRAEGTSVEIAVAAPPVDGAANAELLEALARLLDRPKRDVRLVAGASSRTKVVEIEGVDAAEAITVLARAGGG